MRITAINHVITKNNHSRNTNSIKTQNQIINNRISANKTNEISFNGLQKFGLYLEACALKNEAKANLKKNNKVLNEAQEIKINSEKIKQQANEILTKTEEIKTEIKTLIANSLYKKDGYYIDNPESGVKQRKWQRLDDGIQIIDSRNDGSTRRIFVRKENLTMYEYDKKGNIKEAYLFDPATFELLQYGTNMKIQGEYILEDERYVFTDGNLFSYDTNWMSSKGATYEKSLERYEYETNGEFSAYMLMVEKNIGFKSKIDRLFSFSNNQLYDYCENVVNDGESEKTSAGLRIIYEPNEQLALFLVKDKDVEDNGSNTGKNFEFTNSKLENIYINSTPGKNSISFKKIFIFDENEKPIFCNLNEKYGENGSSFDKQIAF